MMEPLAQLDIFHNAKVIVGPYSSAFMNKMDGAMRRIVPAAVGGGLIFAMASRGGNMSNNELYGQQQPYAGAQQY